MSKHVQERVNLHIDTNGRIDNDDLSAEERLQLIADALRERDDMSIELTIETEDE